MRASWNSSSCRGRAGAAGHQGTLDLLEPGRWSSSSRCSSPFGRAARRVGVRVDQAPEALHRMFADTLLVVPIAITWSSSSSRTAWPSRSAWPASSPRCASYRPRRAYRCGVPVPRGWCRSRGRRAVAVRGVHRLGRLQRSGPRRVAAERRGSQAVVLDGWRLVDPGPPGQVPNESRAAAPVPVGGATEPGDAYNRRSACTSRMSRKRVASPLPSSTNTRRSGRLPRSRGRAMARRSSNSTFGSRSAVDLAAFIREIERGDPHVTRVELVKSKSKKPKEA